MLDIAQIYRDFNIPHKTEGHKHVRPGWIGTPCPFCSGSAGFHLGFAVSGQYAGRFVCWRCGGHPVRKVLSALLKLPESSLSAVFHKYGSEGSQGAYLPVEAKTNARKRSFKYPGGCGPLLPHHATYLERRKFDPEELIAEWGIFSSGPLAPLKTAGKVTDYKHRVMIPIEWEGKVVSFQGRDVTGKHKMKYLACPKEREIIEHKTILYGKVDGEQSILVEGVPDVWRFSYAAECCFGIKFRLQQIKQIAKKRKRVFVLFDPDLAGQAAGGKGERPQHDRGRIVAELRFRGVEVVVLPGMGSDPGDMAQSEADYLMQNLGFRRK